jgi:hypothetical protein
LALPIEDLDLYLRLPARTVVIDNITFDSDYMLQAKPLIDVAM